MISKHFALPNNIDHLIYTAPDLEAGMDHIEDILGVRPVPGGQHHDFGTHNALLSLGPSTYLEVMAPDPSLKSPEQGLLFQGYFSQGPGLTRWVIATEEIEQLALTEVTLSYTISGVTLSDSGPHHVWINNVVYEDGQHLEDDSHIKVIAGSNIQIRITAPDGKMYYASSGETVDVTYITAADNQ